MRPFFGSVRLVIDAARKPGFGRVRSLALAVLPACLLLLGAPQPLHAQAPGLGLTLTTNQAAFAPGDTLRLSIGVTNNGLSAMADFYLVARLPDGDTVLSFVGVDLTPVVGRLSQLATLRPLQAGVNLGGPFTFDGPKILTYQWTGAEPSGEYLFFFAAVRRGSLAQLGPGDVLAVTTASVRLGSPVTFTVDAGHAATAVITSAGGTLQAGGGGGPVYTLTVPPGAVSADTPITLSPLTGVGHLPFTGTFVAGVQGAPAGVVFDKPVTLSIDVPGGVSPGVVGFTTRDDGTGFELVPTAVAGNQLYFVGLTHFSTVSGAIPTDLSELSSLRSASAVQADALVNVVHSTTPPPPGSVAAYGDLLGQWYDTDIRPGLTGAAQSNTGALLSAVEEFVIWDINRSVEAGAFPELRGRFVSRATEGRDLLVSAFRNAVDRTNQRCLAAQSVVIAEDVLGLQSLAKELFELLPLTQVGFSVESLPSPNLATAALDHASVVANLCVKVVIQSATFPANPPAGTPATLSVVAGLSFGGGALVFAPPLTVQVNATGATPPQRIGKTGASGRFSTTFTPSGANAVLSVQVVFDDPAFLFLSGEIFDTRVVPGVVTGVVVTPSQTTLARGQTQQFSAVVGGVTDQRVIWSVTGGGSITQTGLFTAGQSTGTFFVKADSRADPSSVGIAQVTIASVSVVEVNPARPVIDPGTSVEFSAFVNGDSDVTWSVSGGGTITPIGAQRARFTSSGATGMFTVTATSLVNPSISGTATAVVYSGTVVRVGVRTRCVGELRPDDPLSCGFEYLPGPAGSTPVSTTVTTNGAIEVFSEGGRVFLLSTTPTKGGGTVEIRFEGLGVVNTVRYIFEYTGTAATVRCEGSRCGDLPFP